MPEKTTRQVALIILDGWGYREEKENNAIAEANLPFFNSLWQNYPHALLKASGDAVGLPEGQMGNSEVGHMTIGSGRPIDTDLVRIGKAAQAGEFNTNPAFQKLFAQANKFNSTIHTIGLIGPGGVHASSEHLYAFLEAAKVAGVKKVLIHAITDGRDTPPQSGSGYLKELENKMSELGLGEIATVCGRYLAMDRDNNWDRVEIATEAIFYDRGERSNKLPSQAVADKYKEQKVDEHLEPIIFPDAEPFRHNDCVFFFNFRADRARMLAQKITELRDSLGLCFVTMTEYEKDLNALVAFPSLEINNVLAKIVSLAGLTQAHIAETEKFAHATYFLNGGQEEPFTGEEHVLLESRKDIKTHNQAPEMRAVEIGDNVIEHLNKDYDFIFVNFANADMVGHTADVPAIIKAAETIDEQLKRIVAAYEARGGIVFITADHGNAELNVDENGAPHTAHTTNPVPAILTDKNLTIKDGGLADIAPTILKLLNLPAPAEMTGHDLSE